METSSSPRAGFNGAFVCWIDDKILMSSGLEIAASYCSLTSRRQRQTSTGIGERTSLELAHFASPERGPQVVFSRFSFRSRYITVLHFEQVIASSVSVAIPSTLAR